MTALYLTSLYFLSINLGMFPEFLLHSESPRGSVSRTTMKKVMLLRLTDSVTMQCIQQTHYAGKYAAYLHAFLSAHTFLCANNQLKLGGTLLILFLKSVYMYTSECGFVHLNQYLRRPEEGVKTQGTRVSCCHGCWD